TGLRSGWLNSPMIGAYLGDIARVRLFYDGVELPPLDPSFGGANDLGRVPVWSLEDVTVERGADEVRVHMRTWRTQRTTSYTRTDVMTGDEDTNLYRGFFAKRFRRGEALQVGAQQYGTTAPRSGDGGGDALSLLARVGWARARWSADAFVVRTGLTRDPRVQRIGGRLGTPRDTIPRFDGRETQAYARAAWGDPDAPGPWVQLVAASLAVEADTAPAFIVSGSPPDTTLIPRLENRGTQYVAAAGASLLGVRLSVTDRVWAYRGERVNIPSARAAFERRAFSLSLFAQGPGLDSVARLDAIARVMPLGFLAFGGAASRVRDDRSRALHEQATHLRGEVGLRLHELWLIGGVLVRDAARLAAPLVYDTALVAAEEARQTGVFASIQGRIWRGIRVDAHGVAWDTAGVYRPKYQARSDVFIRTSLPRKIRSGNFGLHASLRHDYRSPVYFPQRDGSLGRANTSRVLTGLLEIRIVNAVLFFQSRNFLREEYELVPGYEMPRQVQLYGVRWDFWN
ncbi:MAG TPA: hypothetical protein VNA89_07590, partial [Gemmatimonadaceae bacterium]|nr:hypothetical protein [Gemmatimonadaceae bacterium]